MDIDLMRSAVSHFDESSFVEFFNFLLKQDDSYAGIQRLDKIDARIFENPPERFYQCADTFILSYYPYSIYKRFSLDQLDLSDLKRIITKYFNERTYPLWLPVDGTAVYSINNYDSQLLGISDEELLAFYESQLSSILPSSCQFGIGNINTILQSSERLNGRSIVEQFLKQYNDGICISITRDRVHASRFLNEKEFSGVTPHSKSILLPTITHLPTSDILNQFNQLINSNPKESEIEDFLYEHYQLIFGSKYDQIKRQVWLNFPELDIGGQNRRMDLFLRNAASKDWEIFELKRPTVKLARSIRDVPVFTSAVTETIAQAKNYQKLLAQDSVKRALADDGIEYYEPVINIVIGKTPSLPTANWRRLVSQEKELNILTYDALAEEARIRLDTMKELLDQTLTKF